MTRRRTIPLLVALAALAVVVAAVFGAPKDDTAEGIVLEVDARGLTDVRSVTLRTDEGQTLAFRLGTLENAAAFSPAHLLEHRATAEPVRVRYRTEGAERVAYRVEDAPR